MTEVQKPAVVYEDNQGEIFLENNKQVVMRTNHIDIRHHFLRNMVEDKNMNIQYIRSKKPANIMMKNFPEADYINHMKGITEEELWELVENRIYNVKNNGVLDGVMYCDSTEYSSHTLAGVVDGENRKECILVTRSRIGN